MLFRQIEFGSSHQVPSGSPKHRESRPTKLLRKRELSQLPILIWCSLYLMSIAFHVMLNLSYISFGLSLYVYHLPLFPSRDNPNSWLSFCAGSLLSYFH